MNPDDILIIYTDASMKAVGGVNKSSRWKGKTMCVRIAHLI